MTKSIKILPDVAGLFCLLLFVGLILFSGNSALECADTLWHIKAGTTMLEQKDILAQDIFSHTAYGKQWISHEWLAEIIMGTIYNSTGLAGVVIFYFLLVAFTFWLLFKITEFYNNQWAASLSVTLAFLCAKIHLLPRPHIFSWLFGVITLWILLEGGRKRYLLPLIMIPWANLHGGFILGLALQGIFIAGHFMDLWFNGEYADRRSLAKEFIMPITIFLLSISATGINPAGYKLLIFPFQVTAPIFLNGIVEWRAPDLQDLWFFRLFLLFILFSLIIHKPKISWTNIILMIFFINAALKSQRNISLAGFFLTPVLLELIQPWIKKISDWCLHYIPKLKEREAEQLRLSKTSGPLTTVIVCVLLIFVSACRPHNANINHLFNLPEKFSPKAVQWLNEHPLKGNMFNEYALGGYLIFALEPSQKVFIDGRADMYGEEIFKDYLKISSVDKEVDTLLKKYEIQWVIFPADSVLIRYLKAGGNWDEVYTDEQVSIVVAENLL
jgi:hypothetical protein